MPKLHVLRDLFGSTRDPLPTERDLRLDFFRGLALFAIFIDHIPENFLAWFTLHAVMSGDAAEVFVFTSGFTGGMVYSRAMDRNGFLIAGIRVFHRVWQIYVAHILMFITLMATLAYTSDVLKTSRYIEYYIGTEAFLKEPGLALMRVLSLQYQPSFFMDVLPLYIVCLAVLPLVLAGFRFAPMVVILASLSLWLAVQFNAQIAFPAWPDPREGWGFNPFAWQALYSLGAWLGWRSNQVEVSGLDRRRWVYVAAGCVVAGFLIRFNWTLQGFYGPIVDPIPGEPLWQFLSKADLGVIRFLNILGLAMLVGHMTHPQGRFFGSLVARPFVLCGRNSLYIFCLSGLLALFAQVVLWEVSGRWFVQVAVTAAGIAIMVGFAALLEWFAAARRAASAQKIVGDTEWYQRQGFRLSLPRESSRFGWSEHPRRGESLTTATRIAEEIQSAGKD
jgi:hypothetical protein